LKAANKLLWVGLTVNGYDNSSFILHPSSFILPRSSPESSQDSLTDPPANETSTKSWIPCAGGFVEPSVRVYKKQHFSLIADTSPNRSAQLTTFSYSCSAAGGARSGGDFEREYEHRFTEREHDFL
jgi:hypothetical protein